MCMYTCSIGGGACSPRKFFEIGCSEISSEAILGQKQSRSSCMARGVLHPIFGCPCMHSLSQLADLEFGIYERRNYGRQNSRRCDITRRTTGELSSA